MVDISKKPVVEREALAEGVIILKPETIKLIKENKIEKGDVLQISSVCALNAVKKTPELVPFCHPIPIESVRPEFEIGDTYIKVRVKVKASSKTGVEMDALSGVLNALLNIWDLVKKYEKDSSGNYPFTRIQDVRVVKKVKYD
ncbi:MAG: cyclic pyranopterin monophosphate synthase MoaC [Nitrososphaeria archaeon]|nr:cyclic pyranopterin monophosphate synthase MoaC [Nitrososphaeria archaeon]